MSGYQWRGYGSSWNSRGGGGRFSSYNYPLGKSAGKGNGKNSSLPSLLNQLQSEIAAQQQLQAIASVLTPAVVNTPASSHHVAESAPPQDASFKLLQDEIAALRAELAKSQPPQATQVEPDAVQLFSEIVKEVSQLRQNQPAQVTPKSETQCVLAEQLRSMREELATLKAEQATLPSSKRKRPSTPCAPTATTGDASNVTKVEHREFFNSVFGKRSVLCKVASMPLSEWAAVQAAKLNQADFDSMVAKFEPQVGPEDETDEGVLKACFLLWRLDRAAASTDSARVKGA